MVMKDELGRKQEVKVSCCHEWFVLWTPLFPVPAEHFRSD